MKLLKIAFLLLSISCIAASADIYDELADAIRAGDAHHIAGYFDAKVNLALSNQEDVYSKAQAELLIKDFFSKNVWRICCWLCFLRMPVSRPGFRPFL